MRILITTDWYKPIINGVVTSVVNLETELRQRGHEVKILTLSPDCHSHYQKDVYAIRSCNAGKIYPNARVTFCAHHPFFDELIAWKPDIIHSQCEFTTYSFARHIAKWTNAPLVHTYHTIYEDYTHYFSPNRTIGRKAVSLFSRKRLNRTDAVIAPTDKVKQLLLGYGVKTEIHTIPTGIDCERFARKFPEEVLREERRRLNIPEDGILLVTIGRLAKEKNIEEILRFLGRMQEENIYYLLVGDGPDRTALETLTGELKLQHRVRFAGMIEPSDVPLYYAMGDIFVSASNSETQGLTYLEALASGLPSVCRADDCLNGVIRDGYNGYQYSDFGQFSEKIRQLSADEELRRRLSDGARLIAWRYASDTFCDCIELVYRQMVSLKASQRMYIKAVI